MINLTNNNMFVNSSISTSNNNLNNKDLNNKDLNNNKDLTPEQKKLNLYREHAELSRKGSKIGALDNKLKSGGKLTKEELKYLEVNNKELYEEAVQINKEREAYKKSLKACNSKENVSKKHLDKINNFAEELKGIQNNKELDKGEKLKESEKLSKRFKGILDEYKLFKDSKNYHELPDKSNNIESDNADNTNKSSDEYQDEISKNTKSLQDKINNK